MCVIAISIIVLSQSNRLNFLHVAAETERQQGQKFVNKGSDSVSVKRQASGSGVCSAQKVGSCPGLISYFQIPELHNGFLRDGSISYNITREPRGSNNFLFVPSDIQSSRSIRITG